MDPTSRSDKNGPPAPSEAIQQLDEMVRLISHEISKNYVPEPKIESILEDAINSMKRFRKSVRRKYQSMQREKERKNSPNNNHPDLTNAELEDGLGTNLRPDEGCGYDITPEGSREIECFLYDLEKYVFDEIEKKKMKDARQPNDDLVRVSKLIEKLKKNDLYAVANTDKTNNWILILVAKYSQMVKDHLAKDATLTTREHLIAAHEEALKLLESLSNDEQISEKEFQHAKQTINRRRVPEPILFVKDHKKKDSNGDYQTRLCIPAGNFTAPFPHLGWKAIEALLIKNDAKYQKKNIKNAYALKTTLEKLSIKKNNHSIFTMDIKNMYPSVKFIQIEKAIKYFLRNSSREDQEKAELCLKLISFGMANTFIKFEDQYWLYGGDKSVKEKGLTIGE